MKRITLILTALLLCFAANVSAQGQLTGLKMTVKVDGGEPFVEAFQASGVKPLDLTSQQFSSIIIDGAEVSATGTVSEAKVMGTVYKQGSSPEEWREIPLINQGDGTWKISGLNAELIDDVFGSGIPVLDISHGKGDKLISVKVSEGQGIALPGQIRDIGIQLIPVAPVVIPRFIGEYIPEKLRNDLPVRDSQFSQFHKGAPW